MAKVLVLGGGFAWVEVSICLRKQGMDITLVSDRDFFTSILPLYGFLQVK